jgi:dephospho-CoA kinase
MLKVGLTGGIACGKSAVRRELASLGAFTVDADQIARDVLTPGHAGYSQVVELFGREFLLEDLSIDRRKLAGLIFADAESRRTLNAIVHPHVHEQVAQLLEEAQQRTPTPSLAVVDAALMVETGSFCRYQALLVVYCSPEIQLRRLMARDGLSIVEARRRIDSQASVLEKARLADYVLDSSGEQEATLRQTRFVYRRLTAGR